MQILGRFFARSSTLAVRPRTNFPTLAPQSPPSHLNTVLIGGIA